MQPLSVLFVSYVNAKTQTFQVVVKALTIPPRVLHRTEDTYTNRDDAYQAAFAWCRANGLDAPDMEEQYRRQMQQQNETPC
jgi:hypothetical protein